MYLLNAGSTSIHLSFLLHENSSRVTVKNSRECKKVAFNFLERQRWSGFINLKLIVKLVSDSHRNWWNHHPDGYREAFFICYVNVERKTDISNSRRN
jgi:hypothetical protein